MGLDSVEIVMMFEEHFEIEITDQEATTLSTVGEMRDLICKKLLVKKHRANPDLILKEIIDLTANYAAIDIKKIGVDSDFVTDLKID
jgi:acyl carrier protein